ncbi:MAG TPA: hypothetical protein VKW06_04725 [Candidatus Angelobacter sp.]|nr:hypothetical protein [Candidatus Angelobacter sp.]
MKKHLQLATLFFAAGLAAAAQTSTTRLYRSSGNEWIQEVTGTLPASKQLRVKSSAGAIRVQGGQRSSVAYTIREHVRARSEDAARRELSHLYFSTSSGEVASLRAECEGSNGGYIDFEVQAPAQTALVKLETQGGSVTAQNIAGKLEASTGGGNIQLDQIRGGISASSGGGNIEIGKVGGDVIVETGGGNIHIDSAAGRIQARSGGGNLRIGNGKVMDLQTGGGGITVTKCEGQIKAGTGGGSIELVDILGPAQVQSGGGGIKVGPLHGGVRAETGSGPIIATLARGNVFTDSRLETSVGDITVYVPSDLGVTIRAAVEVSRGYGIRSDFPELKITQGSDHWGPREAYAEGALNGGGPLLHVHTSSGNIVFKRKEN